MISILTFQDFIKIQILLAIGVICYELVIKKTTFLGFQRFYLLAIIGISLSLPWWPQVSNIGLVPTQFLPAITIKNTAVIAAQLSSIPFSITFGYWVISMALSLWGLAKLVFVMVRIHTRSIQGAFSFFTYIQVDLNLPPKELELVRIHEKAHVQQLHSMDIILVELVTILCWINPFVWVLKRELKNVHEYLADAAVLRNIHSDVKGTYAKLILAQQFNISSSVLIHSFSAPSLVTKRINMMNKKSQSLHIKIGMFIAVLLFISTAIAVAYDPNSTLDNTQELQIEKNMADLTKMPEFNGGMEGLMTYISQHIYYPKEAVKTGVEGKVFIQFVIDVNGSVVQAKVLKSLTPDLDKVALTAIQEMPQWTPGEKNGNLVNVQFVLPITFSLDQE